MFDAGTSVKYFGGLHPPNIWGNHIRQIIWGSTLPKYLTEPHLSNILGVFIPQIFDGTTSVKYFGGVGPPNI